MEREIFMKTVNTIEKTNRINTNNIRKSYTIVKKKRNSKRVNKLIVITMTFILLIFGTAFVLENGWKIVDTSIKLIDINFTTQAYNEQYKITDELTDAQELVNEERQAIYNSDDYVVREFSRKNFIIKTLILMLSVIAIVKLPATWKFILKGMTKIIFDDENEKTKWKARVSVKR